MRRVTIVLACTALASVAIPSQAQKVVTATVLRPANREFVSSTIQAKAKGSSTAGLERVELFVDGVSVASEEPSGIKQNVELTYNWDTHLAVGSGETSANGEHTVVVEAEAKTGASDKATTKVFVDNPPATPSGLRASITDRVILSWTANAEPDLTGYLVERDSGSGFVLVGETHDQVFSERVAPGTHSYRVTAVRASPSGSGTRASPPSAAVQATVIAPPPATGGVGGRGGSGRGERSRSNAYAGGLGIRGLPSALGSAGTTGLPQLPAVQGTDLGTYEAELPYDLPAGGVPIDAASIHESEPVPWRVIPPDGLRWVAAGLLLVVTSGLLRFTAVRITARDQ